MRTPNDQEMTNKDEFPKSVAKGNDCRVSESIRQTKRTVLARHAGYYGFARSNACSQFVLALYNSTDWQVTVYLGASQLSDSPTSTRYTASVQTIADRRGNI